MMSRNMERLLSWAHKHLENEYEVLCISIWIFCIVICVNYEYLLNYWASELNDT